MLPNLLISHRWNDFFPAQQEIRTILKKFGDEKPKIEKTLARGIAGVETSLNNRQVIKKCHQLFQKNPLEFQFTLKWIPVDHWCPSDLKEMLKIIKKIKDQIKPQETWAMQVEKRRFTKYHTKEIIEELAKSIERKVNLNNPDKIIRIDLLGNNTVITLLKPEEVFSVGI